MAHQVKLNWIHSPPGICISQLTSIVELNINWINHHHLCLMSTFHACTIPCLFLHTRTLHLTTSLPHNAGLEQTFYDEYPGVRTHWPIKKSIFNRSYVSTSINHFIRFSNILLQQKTNGTVNIFCPFLLLKCDLWSGDFTGFESMVGYITTYSNSRCVSYHAAMICYHILRSGPQISVVNTAFYLTT